MAQREGYNTITISRRDLASGQATPCSSALSTPAFSLLPAKGPHLMGGSRSWSTELPRGKRLASPLHLLRRGDRSYPKPSTPLPGPHLRDPAPGPDDTTKQVAARPVNALALREACSARGRGCCGLPGGQQGRVPLHLPCPVLGGGLRGGKRTLPIGLLRLQGPRTRPVGTQLPLLPGNPVSAMCSHSPVPRGLGPVAWRSSGPSPGLTHLHVLCAHGCLSVFSPLLPERQTHRL